MSKAVEMNGHEQFFGFRTGGHRGIPMVTLVPSAGRSADYLPPRNDLRDHSPDGFEWGYGGSGPAQLALAMVAYALEDDEKALRLYQLFKEVCVSRLADPRWKVRISDVIKWAEDPTPWAWRGFPRSRDGGYTSFIPQTSSRKRRKGRLSRS